MRTLDSKTRTITIRVQFEELKSLKTLTFSSRQIQKPVHTLAYLAIPTVCHLTSELLVWFNNNADIPPRKTAHKRGKASTLSCIMQFAAQPLSGYPIIQPMPSRQWLEL